MTFYSDSMKVFPSFNNFQISNNNFSISWTVGPIYAMSSCKGWFLVTGSENKGISWMWPGPTLSPEIRSLTKMFLCKELSVVMK